MSSFLTLLYGVMLATGISKLHGELVTMNFMDQAIQERVRKGYNQHIVTAFVNPKGATFAYAGNFDTPPEEAIFEIGSLTKLFTAHLLLILEKEKMISLDAPIEKYLKGVSIPQYKNHKISFRHLLSHTSGLKDPCIENYYNPLNGNTVPFAEYTVSEMYDYLEKTHLEFPPGAKILYSNLGYGLIGHILETIMCQSYFSLLKEKILDPLGMKSTFIYVPEEFLCRNMEGSAGGKIASYWEAPNFPAFGALKSTAQDLSIYLRQFLSGPLDCVSHEIHRKMTTACSDWDQDSISMCLGWTVDRRFEGSFLAATGQTLGFSSFMGFCPMKKEGIIILTDASQLDFLGHYWFNPNFPLAPLHTKIDLDENILKKFKGLYTNKEGLSLEIEVGHGYLILKAPHEIPINLYPKDQNHFFPRFLSFAPESVYFQIIDDKIARLTIIQNRNELIFERGGEYGR